jgi:casein kinase II subunit beta
MSDDSEFSEEIEVGWINWFCNLEDHNFLIEVDQAYIRDSSNLYGLKSRVQRYEEALNMILRHRPPSEVEIEDPK